MGSGIAAHMANLGFQVTVLDATEETARAAWERATRARPPHFMVPETAENVRLGGIYTHLHWAQEADWVCEAVVEKLDVKRALFEQLDQALSESTIITTNTSGLEIELLREGRSDRFRRSFLGTHFFNPPRYLKLLELIPTSDTDPTVVERITEFLEDHAARRVVRAKDTPGFIANRYGMWSMFSTIQVTERLGMTIEEVDAICGPFLGRPRSAAFRLNDLVGLDIMMDIADNLRERCPHDAMAQSMTAPQSLAVLMEKGWIGNKAGQGYYRKEGQEFLSFDLQTHAYRMRREPEFAALDALARQPLGERIAAGLELKDPAGEFLREYLVPALKYAVQLAPEISYSYQDFDRVMQWGFGWEQGPFAMIDAIGPERLGIPEGPFYKEKTIKTFAGTWVPQPAEPNYQAIADFPILQTFDTLYVRDLGDGVHAVCTRTKMGTISPQLLDDLNTYLDGHPDQRFVLTSEAKVFSFGFDLSFFRSRIDEEDWAGVDAALAKFQATCHRLSQHACVAAIHGYGIGGGLELALGCPVVVASAEAQLGYPEAKVGLIPGGAGTVRMRLFHQENAKSLVEAAKVLAKGELATNAVLAQRQGVLRRTDVVSFHPDRWLHDAKQAALTVAPRPWPVWTAVIGPLAGMMDRAFDEWEKAGATRHDRKIADAVGHVFSKPSNLEEAFTRERHEFVALIQEGLTQARIRHMLDTGKPLRN